MAKSLSSELNDFLKDLNRNAFFLNVERRITNPASSRSRPRSETLLSAYVTLTCGRLESFLKRSFRASAQEINHKLISAKDQKLGANFYWNNLNGFVTWASRAKGVERPDMIAMIESFSASITAGTIHPKSFDATDANPTAETVKKMFNRFGVADPMQKVSAAYVDTFNRTLSRKLVEDYLDTFVRRRNQAAHEGRIAGATRVDIYGDHVFVGGFASAVSKVLTSHIAAL